MGRPNISTLRLRPHFTPYLVVGLCISILSAIQFYLIDANASISRMGDTGALRLAGAAVGASLFLSSVVFGMLTSYEISGNAVAVRVFPFRSSEVSTSYISMLRIQKTLCDRLLRTDTVLFLSRYGKVLQRWNFVRLTDANRSRLRRISLLLSSMSGADGRQAGSQSRSAAGGR